MTSIRLRHANTALVKDCKANYDNIDHNHGIKSIKINFSIIVIARTFAVQNST